MSECSFNESEYYKNLKNRIDIIEEENKKFKKEIDELNKYFGGPDGVWIDAGMDHKGIHRWIRPDDVKYYCQELIEEIIKYRQLYSELRLYLDNSKPEKINEWIITC